MLLPQTHTIEPGGRMERRNLLIGLGALMVAPVTVLAANTPISMGRFRLEPGGRVLVRDANGWRESIHLGDDIRVISISDTGAQAVLTASHAGQSFQLRSADGACWQVA